MLYAAPGDANTTNGIPNTPQVERKRKKVADPADPTGGIEMPYTPKGPGMSGIDLAAPHEMSGPKFSSTAMSVPRADDTVTRLSDVPISPLDGDRTGRAYSSVGPATTNMVGRPGSIGAIDAVAPGPVNAATSIGSPGGTVVGPGMGGRPAPRPTTTAPVRPPTYGPPSTTQAAGTVSDREHFNEDTRRFDLPFNEDVRRYDTNRGDANRQRFLDDEARKYEAQVAANLARNRQAPSMAGIGSAGPQQAFTPTGPDTREGWAHDTQTQAADWAHGDAQDALHHQWNLDEEKQIRDYIDKMGPKFDGPGAPGGGSGIDPAETAARAAAFARAKEQAGSTARASLNSLYDVMASSGRAGSGAEAQLSADVAGGAAGDVNDFTREQYIQDLDRSNQVSDRNYQGGLTKRAQDMGWMQSLLGLLSSGRRLY